MNKQLLLPMYLIVRERPDNTGDCEGFLALDLGPNRPPQPLSEVVHVPKADITKAPQLILEAAAASVTRAYEVYMAAQKDEKTEEFKFVMPGGAKA